jgi:hypothetical protein
MSLTDFFSQTIQNPFWHWFLFGPCLLIVLDFITGCTAAILNRQFSFTHLPQFLGSNVLPLLLASCLVVAGYFCFGGAAVGTAIANVLGMGTLSVTVASSITSNIAEIIKRNPRLVPEPIVQEIQSVTQNATQMTPPKVTPMSSSPQISLPASNPGLPSSSLGVRAQMEMSSVFPAVKYPKNI